MRFDSVIDRGFPLKQIRGRWYELRGEPRRWRRPLTVFGQLYDQMLINRLVLQKDANPYMASLIGETVQK